MSTTISIHANLRKHLERCPIPEDFHLLQGRIDGLLHHMPGRKHVDDDAAFSQSDTHLFQALLGTNLCQLTAELPFKQSCIHVREPEVWKAQAEAHALSLSLAACLLVLGTAARMYQASNRAGIIHQHSAITACHGIRVTHRRWCCTIATCPPIEAIAHATVGFVQIFCGTVPTAIINP
jgi:hypothetical protein